MSNQREGGYVEVSPPAAARTFEIGLVMAGAISAGTYAAGVIDYLIEALDTWEEEKARVKGTPEESQVPQHSVLIKVVTAASAGSMNGAILAVAAGRKFHHVGSKDMGIVGYAHATHEDQQRMLKLGALNPFYKAWVLDISMDRLLGTDDLDGKDSVLQSLLDSTPITAITRECLRFKGDGAISRSYFADPTRYIFSVGNLRGIPYYISLTGKKGIGLGMSAHRDYRSFTVSYSAGAVSKKLRADDIALVPPRLDAKDVSDDWKTLGITAIASGAFPVGLAPRPMTRRPEDYMYRFVILPGCSHDRPAEEDGTIRDAGRAVPLIPNPERLGDFPYNTFLVDGGTMNNDPVDLARKELAGLLGRNFRSGTKANRAIVMIDPFPDAKAQGQEPLAGLSPAFFPVFMNLLGAWKNQSRFTPEDIALAADDEIYSRFLISPSRGNPKPGDKQIQPDLACGALSGFSGFFNLDFRHHDYLLGRRNAQKFLSDVFTLPAANPLFGEPDQPRNLDSKWTRKGGDKVDHLPIIPLMDSLLPATLSNNLTIGRMEELSAWPVDLFDISSVERAVKNRVSRVISHAINNSSMSWVRRFGAKALGMVVKGHIHNMILNEIHDGLAVGGLIEKRKGRDDVSGPTVDWFAQPPKDL